MPEASEHTVTGANLLTVREMMGRCEEAQLTTPVVLGTSRELRCLVRLDPSGYRVVSAARSLRRHYVVAPVMKIVFLYAAFS